MKPKHSRHIRSNKVKKLYSSSLSTSISALTSSICENQNLEAEAKEKEFIEAHKLSLQIQRLSRKKKKEVLSEIKDIKASVERKS